MILAKKNSKIFELIKGAVCHAQIVDGFNYNLFMTETGSYLSFSNAIRVIRDSEHVAVLRRIEGSWYVRMICPNHIHLLEEPISFLGLIKRILGLCVND